MSDVVEGESQVRQRVFNHPETDDDSVMENTEKEPDSHSWRCQQKTEGSDKEEEDEVDEKAPFIFPQDFDSDDNEHFSDASEYSQAVLERLKGSPTCSFVSCPKAKPVPTPPPSYAMWVLFYLYWVFREIVDFVLLFLITLFNPNSDISSQIASFKVNRAQRRESLFRSANASSLPGCGGCGCI